MISGSSPARSRPHPTQPLPQQPGQAPRDSLSQRIAELGCGDVKRLVVAGPHPWRTLLRLDEAEPRPARLGVDRRQQRGQAGAHPVGLGRLGPPAPLPAPPAKLLHRSLEGCRKHSLSRKCS